MFRSDPTIPPLPGVLFAVFLSVVMSAHVFAQGSQGYGITKSEISQAGEVSESAGYKIIDTVGQPSAVGKYVSEPYQLNAGFLARMEMPTGAAQQDAASIPMSFKLLQNYPNPFNPETTIEYHLPRDSEVSIVIYDLQGHLVRMLVHEKKPAGIYAIKWDGRNDDGRMTASGIYFYRLIAGDFRETKKCLAVK